MDPESTTTSKPVHFKSLPSPIADMILWENVVNTGAVFTLILTILISLQFMSIISVVAYLGLATISLAVSWKIYNEFIRKFTSSSNDNNGYAESNQNCASRCMYMERFYSGDEMLSDEEFSRMSDCMRQSFNCLLNNIGLIVTFNDYVKVAKVVTMLYLMTYIGEWFNLLTLVTLIVVATFCIPKLYLMNQEHMDQLKDILVSQMDQYWRLAKDKIIPMLPPSVAAMFNKSQSKMD